MLSQTAENVQILITVQNSVVVDSLFTVAPIVYGVLCFVLVLKCSI